MTTREFIDIFLKYEYTSGLFDWQISGVKIWPYIRTLVYRELRFRLFGIEELWKPNIEREFEGPWNLNRLIDKYVKRNPCFAHQRDILIVSHARKWPDYNNTYRDLYTYWLDKELDISHYVLDRNIESGAYYLSSSVNILTEDIVKYNRWHNCESIYSIPDKKDIAKELFDSLERELGLLDNCFKNRIMSHIVFCLRERTLAQNYFDFLLDRINPRIVILVTSYDYYMQNLIEVSKKRNIETIELQHGRIGDMHVSYNYYDRLEIESFPDYVFCFGEYDKTAVRWPIAPERILPVGYPELEKSIESIDVKKDDSFSVILFVGGNDEILHYTRELYYMLDPSRYHLIYKCHPSEIKNWDVSVQPFLDGTNVEIVHDMEKTIHYYIKQSDWVIGNDSTSLYEATVFKKRIAVVKGKYSDVYLKDLYESRMAVLINNTNELARMINNNEYNAVINDDYFFAKDSINNMIRNIHSIMREEKND